MLGDGHLTETKDLSDVTEKTYFNYHDLDLHSLRNSISEIKAPAWNKLCEGR